MIVQCDSCKTYVMPMRDGVCPACRWKMSFPETASTETAPVEADRTGMDRHEADPEILFEEQLEAIESQCASGLQPWVDSLSTAEGCSEAPLAQFIDAWRTGVAEIADYLPPDDGSPESLPARKSQLIALIEQDFLVRWWPGYLRKLRHGEALESIHPARLRLQDYVDLFPELGSLNELPLRMIAIEFRCRLAAGENPKIEEYVAADPARSEEIRDELFLELKAAAPARPVLCNGVLPTLGRCIQLLFFTAVTGSVLRHVVVNPGAPVPTGFSFTVATIAALCFALMVLGKFHPHDVRRVIAWRRPALLHTVIAVLLPAPYLLVLSQTPFGVDRAIGQWPILAINWEAHFEAYAALAREPLWLVIVVGCLLPAVAEEIFFRALIGRGLVRAWGTVGGVLMTSLIFGLFHLQPDHVVMAFLLGVLLHLVYLATKSIMAPMLLHAVNNMIAFGVLRWSQSGDFSPAVEGRFYVPFGLLAASLFALIMFLVMLRQTRSRWLSADSGEWTPGFVSAETPPVFIPAIAVLRRCRRSTLALAAVSYVLFAVTVCLTIRSWTGITHANAALTCLATGLNEKANEESLKSLTIQPDLAWIHAVRAEVLAERGDLPAAEEFCNSSLKLNPSISRACSVKGWLRYLAEDHTAAIELSTTALQLDRSDARAYFTRGAASFCRHESGDAVLDTTEAIRLNPEFATAWAIRGAARVERDQLDVALKDLMQATKLDSSDAFSWSWQARACYELEKYPEAIDAAKQSLELDPVNAQALYYQGLALQEQGEDAAAIDSFSALLEIDPDDDGIRLIRAKLLLGQQRAIEAITDLDILIPRYPQQQELYSLRSQAHRALGNDEKALIDEQSLNDL